MYSFPRTRWSLIAALPGQPKQIGTLVAIYAEAVAAYLRSRLVGERSDRVEDVIQEVLVDLLGKPEVLAKAGPGDGSRFRYYLMHLAWHGAQNALRRHRRRDDARGAMAGDPDDAVDSATARLAADLPAPERAAMDRAWAAGVIQGALDDLRGWVDCDRLPPEGLRILVRNLVEGHALRDIAADLALPIATCHRRYAQARTALREAICERLRLAGELGPSEDPAAACEILLSAVARG